MPRPLPQTAVMLGLNMTDAAFLLLDPRVAAAIPRIRVAVMPEFSSGVDKLTARDALGTTGLHWPSIVVGDVACEGHRTVTTTESVTARHWCSIPGPHMR